MSYTSIIPRVTVLGTSNSIIRNASTAALRADPRINVTTNLSLSFSDCSLFPFRLERLEQLEQDVVVHELAIGDQVSAGNGVPKFELVARILDSFFDWCARRQVRPIVVAFPVLAELEGTALDDVVAIRTLYSARCRAAGVRFVDGNVEAEAMAATAGLAIAELFMDGFHLKPDFGTLMGRRIADLAAEDPDYSSTPTVSSCHHYEFVGCEDLERQTVRRTTSLADSAVCEIDVGRPATWVTSRIGSRIVGIVFNLARSNAPVVLSSRKHLIAKDLGTPYFDPTRELWLCAWGLETGLEIGDTVRITMGTTDLSVAIEPGFSERLSASPAEPRSEIAGFILERATHTS